MFIILSYCTVMQIFLLKTCGFTGLVCEIVMFLCIQFQLNPLDSQWEYLIQGMQMIMSFFKLMLKLKQVKKVEKIRTDLFQGVFYGIWQEIFEVQTEKLSTPLNTHFNAFEQCFNLTLKGHNNLKSNLIVCYYKYWKARWYPKKTMLQDFSYIHFKVMGLYFLKKSNCFCSFWMNAVPLFYYRQL